MMLTAWFVLKPIPTGAGADLALPFQTFLNNFLQQLFMNGIFFYF